MVIVFEKISVHNRPTKLYQKCLICVKIRYYYFWEEHGMTTGEKQVKAASVHQGHRARMKERLRQEGLGSFADHQVLELLLFYAIPQRDTNELAHRLLRHFGTLSGVLGASYEQLQEVPGIGAHAASLISMMPELFRRYQKDRWENRVQITSLTELAEFACSLFVGVERETFHLICMDTQNRIIAAPRLAEGVVNEVRIYPRTMVELALRHNAKSVALTHNHPGGSLKPSAADIDLTRNAIRTLRPIDINVWDHIIVCGDQYYSFSKMGMLFCD